MCIYYHYYGADKNSSVCIKELSYGICLFQAFLGHLPKRKGIFKTVKYYYLRPVEWNNQETLLS